MHQYATMRFENQQGYRGFCGNGQISTFTCNQNSSGYSFTKNYEARYQAPPPLGNHNSSGYSFTKNFEARYQVPPPPTPPSKIISMLEQILEEQQKIRADLNGKMDYLRPTNVKGNMVFSYEEYVSATTLRSGKELNYVQQRGLSADELVELEGIEAEGAAEVTANTPDVPVSIDTNLPCRSTHMCNPAIKLLDSDAETPKHVDRQTPGHVDRHTSSSSPILPASSPKHEERVYQPQVPYPVIPKKSKQELEEAKCKAMDKTPTDLPKINGFRDSLNAASPRSIGRQKVPHPTPHTPRTKQIAFVSSFDDCAGKRSIPPIPRSRRVDVPPFLGRSHALTAYTPPWMMRYSPQKYLLPPSKPPDV